MLKLPIEIVKRFCKLKENEVVKGADGETYYTIRREGDYLIIVEQTKEQRDECEYRGIDPTTEIGA